VVVVVVAVVAAVLILIAVVVYRLTRPSDTVETFRRQIDALSPEARRTVVDQVKGIDDRSDTQSPDAVEAVDDVADDERGRDDDGGAGRDGT
jgi:hypothetical protein